MWYLLPPFPVMPPQSFVPAWPLLTPPLQTSGIKGSMMLWKTKTLGTAMVLAMTVTKWSI